MGCFDLVNTYFLDKMLMVFEVFDVDKDGKVINETEMGSINHHQKAVKIGFSAPGTNSSIKEWIYISGDLNINTIIIYY